MLEIKPFPNPDVSFDVSKLYETPVLLGVVHRRIRRAAAAGARAHLVIWRALYELYNLRVQGTGEVVYQALGYRSFFEAAMEELHVPRKAAQRGVAIWYKFGVEFQGRYNKRLVGIGPTKARVLVGNAVTSSTVEVWLTFAETHTYDELVRQVRSSIPVADPAPRPSDLAALYTLTFRVNRVELEILEEALAKARRGVDSKRRGVLLALLAQKYLRDS